MESDRIVNCRPDFAFGQVFAQSVAHRCANDILMINVMIRQTAVAVGLPGRNNRFNQANPNEFRTVKIRSGAPRGRPLFQIWKLGSEYGSLYFVQAKITSN